MSDKPTTEINFIERKPDGRRWRRVDVVPLYVDIIQRHGNNILVTNDEISAINKAIMDRWCYSTLEWIKNRAWAIVAKENTTTVK